MYSGLGGPWGGQAPPLVPPPPPQQHISHFSQPPPWQHFTSPPPPPMVHQPPPVSLISQPPPVPMMPPALPAQIPLPLLPAPLPSPAAAPPLPQPPTPAPPPPPLTVLPPPSSSTTPVQSSDMLQSALDTVAQAQGHIANLRHQLTPMQPTGSLRGIKRKSLASALTGSKSGSHHLDWTSSWDSEMPPDLLAKCRPLHCQLCDVQATSPVQAKMHYQGKTHDKHVRNYFTSLNKLNNLNSAVPIPQKLSASGQKMGSEDEGRPQGLHCSICDLAFTSFSQVEQHLAGKNHTRLAAGLPGLKAGYFNKATGKWERAPPEEHQETPTPAPTPSLPSTSLGSKVANEHNFYCQLCKVGAPSQTQMDMHLNGKNHKAKMKRSMGGVENGDLTEIQKRVNLKESIMAVVTKRATPVPLGKAKTKMKPKTVVPTAAPFPPQQTDEFSQYRTPSGQYYCGPCNLSLNSTSQFQQHQASKKHKMKEAKARRP